MSETVLLADLARRVEALERAWLTGDADRVVLFAEACQGIRRSPDTVRKWYASPKTRERYSLDTLFTKDPTGHLTSSPRRIEKWKREVAARFTPPALTRKAAERRLA